MEKGKIIFIIIAVIIVVALIGGVIFSMIKTGGINKQDSNTETKNDETQKDNTVKTSSNENKISNTESNTQNKEENKGENKDMLSGKYNAEIVVKNYGTIKLELDDDIAPITVTNFVKLTKQGFYDGLTFHRIMDGFMIQGGDPLGTGMGGSQENIKGEFAQNGIKNPISHVRGVISMARAYARDSASSQFFIVQKDSTFLDGAYAGFGHVTSGMEIVDKICKDVTPIDDNGTVLKQNQPIIEAIKIVD